MEMPIMPTDAEVLAVLARAQSRRGLECLTCPEREAPASGCGCVNEARCLEDLRALREWTKKQPVAGG